MGTSWLFRPLPLRERVGRGVAPVSSTLRTRRFVVPSPPLPNPLPQGEREPEIPSTKGVIAISTVLGLAPPGSHLPLRSLNQAPEGWVGQGRETTAERNKFATKEVGIRGRSRPTLQHARPAPPCAKPPRKPQ